MSTFGQSYRRWHNQDHPYLVRKRLRLEALLGSACSYCGLTREDGVNLQFHHHLGRSYTSRKLSWGMRLARYKQEIEQHTLLYLACDESGNNCHEKCRRQAPRNDAAKLYDYPPPPCDENCTRCSGEYCETHFDQPCNCDAAQRHDPESNDNEPF